VHALREAGWPRVIALAPTADIGPVIDAVGAGVSGVLIGRRANPATASIPSTKTMKPIHMGRLAKLSTPFMADLSSLSSFSVTTIHGTATTPNRT